jgi:hypothetical protein
LLPLPELQGDFVRSLGAQPSPALLAAVEPDGLAAADRLRIYSNHFRLSLVEALGTTFPVVRRLLGEDCFGQVAGQFARRHPPRLPCLFEYGRRLASFLGDQPQLRGLPWLPDVARLEWALNEARHAADAPLPEPRLDPLPLADPDRLAFGFAPSVRFLASQWPVDQIWRVNQPANDHVASVVLEARGASLLILRDADDEVGWLPLPRVEFVFVRALAAGHSLRRAHLGAATIDRGFTPLPLLRALIGAGAITDLAVLPKPERAIS